MEIFSLRPETCAPGQWAQNTDGEKVGILNRISSYIYKLKGFFQSIKKWNRKVYYAGKYALMAGIVVLILFGAYLRHR